MKIMEQFLGNSKFVPLFWVFAIDRPKVNCELINNLSSQKSVFCQQPSGLNVASLHDKGLDHPAAPSHPIFDENTNNNYVNNLRTRVLLAEKRSYVGTRRGALRVFSRIK